MTRCWSWEEDGYREWLEWVSIKLEAEDEETGGDEEVEGSLSSWVWESDVEFNLLWVVVRFGWVLRLGFWYSAESDSSDGLVSILFKELLASKEPGVPAGRGWLRRALDWGFLTLGDEWKVGLGLMIGGWLWVSCDWVISNLPPSKSVPSGFTCHFAVTATGQGAWTTSTGAGGGGSDTPLLFLGRL